MTSEKFPYLFSEGKIGRMTLRNRTVMPAMETNYAEDNGEVNDRVLAYYERRAKGGVGLIIVEGACIDPEGKGFKNDIGIDEDRLVPGLKRLADGIKGHGARAAIQLLHAGRQTRSRVTGSPLVAPSAIPCFLMGEMPVALTEEKILHIQERYAQAARRARKAGFNAVEVHGAHGYLIHQFLSPLANQRGDAYGGSREKRLRFAREVLEKIRRAVGDDFPIILRLSAKEFMEKGIDLPLSTYYCKKLSPIVDALHISGGAYGSHEWISQPYSNEPGLYAPLAGHIKREVDVPVITVGRLQDPALANRVIADGNADFIAIGRGLIADPDLPAKAEKGNVDEIWPCLSCNIGCVDRLGLQQDIACLVNPWVGKEGVEPAGIIEDRTCLVCGGGPAGLSAAVALAERGARVVLAEGGKIGGQFMLASKMPYKGHFADLITRYVRRLNELEVEVVKTNVDVDLVQKINPDLVVAATGTTPVVLPIPGLDTIRHMTYIEALGVDFKEDNIVIVGGGATSCELAELLLEQGRKVTIVEMQKNLAGELLPMRPLLLKRLNRLCPVIYNDTRISAVRNKDIILEKGEDEKITLTGVQCLIFVCGVKPDNRLEKELSEEGINVVSIGDCRNSRNAFWAVRDGFETALDVFSKTHA